jgi:O-antigen ligase/tetratricopeptide (TPR) repeat protein
VTETSRRSRSSNHLRVYFEPGDEIDTIWDPIIFWTLAGMILLLPLCLGVPPDYAWAETLFMIGATAVGTAYALKLITNRDPRMQWSWSYVPIAVFLLLCVVQLVPLPAGVLNLLSPATLKLRTELMHDVPDAAERLRLQPLTFYFENSVRQLRLLFALVVVFVVTLNSIRRLDQIKKLVLVIACVGALIALVALLQDITRTGKILFLDKPADDPYYVAHAGPFRNHSHFSHYMNLCLGAAMAVALLNYKQTVRGAYSAMKDRLAAREYQLLFGALATILLCALAIVLSTSRSGMAAMAGSGIIALIMIARKQRLSAARTIAGILALLVLGTGLVMAFPSVRESFSQLSGRSYSVRERQQIISALPAQWQQYPVVGTGLNAFEVVFPMFDISRQERIATHAENEYAQLMTETGAVGVLMALLFIAMLAWSYIKVLRKGSSDAAAIAIGLGYGVLAVLIQSAVDFGQHLMANATLMAITSALLLNLRQIHRRSTEVQKETRPGNVPLRVLASVLVIALLVWSIVGGVRTSIAQSSWKKAEEVEKRLRLLQWQAEKPIFAEALRYAERAVRFSPHNVVYRHWLNVYRWYAGAIDLPHEKNGSVSNGPQLEKFVGELVADLNDARWLCPTYAPNYSQIGWYESFQLERDSGGAYIRTAYRLSPNDPAIVMRAGEQEAFDGNNERSAELLNRSMELDGFLIPGVLDFYLYEMKRPDLALAASRGKLNAMQTLANRLEATKLAPDVLAQARRELRETYLAEAAKPKPDANMVAWAAEAEHREGNDQHAIELYREALTIDYGAVSWRLALARLLLQSGDNEGAIRQAQICLRLQPHMPEAQQIIGEASKDRPHPGE